MGAYAVVALVAGVLLALGLRRAEKAFRTYRGMRVLACPETRQFAAVELKGGRAAWTAVFGSPELRVIRCSRWPDHGACDQVCVQNVRQAPAKTLVRTIVADWCRYNACICCGAPLGKLRVDRHRPHVMSRDNLIHDWTEIAPEEIPGTLGSLEPVCETCVAAETHTW